MFYKVRQEVPGWGVKGHLQRQRMRLERLRGPANWHLAIPLHQGSPGALYFVHDNPREGQG